MSSIQLTCVVVVYNVQATPLEDGAIPQVIKYQQEGCGGQLPLDKRCQVFKVLRRNARELLSHSTSIAAGPPVAEQMSLQ